MMNHTKFFYNIMDWSAQVGGASQTVMFVLIAMFGKMSHFSSRIEMMLHMYSDQGFFKSELQNAHGVIEHEGGNKEI